MQLTNYLEFFVNNGWIIIVTILILSIVIFLFIRKIIRRKLSIMYFEIKKKSINAETKPEIRDTPDSDKNDEIIDQSKEPLGSELSKMINLEIVDPFSSINIEQNRTE